MRVFSTSSRFAEGVWELSDELGCEVVVEGGSPVWSTLTLIVDFTSSKEDIFTFFRRDFLLVPLTSKPSIFPLVVKDAFFADEISALLSFLRCRRVGGATRVGGAAEDEAALSNEVLFSTADIFS